MSKARRPRPHRQSPTPLKTPPGPAPADTTAITEPDADPAPAEASPGSQAETGALSLAAEPIESETRDEAAPLPAGTGAAAEPAAAPVPADETPAAPRGPTTLPRFDAGSFGTTVVNYMIGEGNAFAAHMRALAGARSVGEVVRLQIGEFQRAADATLTCWGSLTVAARRTTQAR